MWLKMFFSIQEFWMFGICFVFSFVLYVFVFLFVVFFIKYCLFNLILLYFFISIII